MKKNSNHIWGYLSIVAVITLFLFSCNKGINDTPQTDNEQKGTVYEYIKKLGYKDSEIKDIGEDYLVDGDMLFSKKSQPDFSIFNGPKTEQYGTSSYVGYDKQTFVAIYVDPSAAAFSSEVADAVDLWNNVPNCRLNFQVIGSLIGADIVVMMYNLASGECARAYTPMNGNPGSLIKLGNGLFQFLPYDQRMAAIAHEIGHTIGFRHTNWISLHEPQELLDDVGAHADATHILGTPTGDDFNSIMNGFTCGESPTTLSNFDILAVQFLYPENPPAAGTVPVFRYYEKENLEKHFFTTNYSELGDGNNHGFIFEGIGFFAFPNQVAGSVGVHRWYNPVNGDHFYTANPNEIPAGYTYEGIRFYVYPSAINGAVPVHGYF